MDLKKQSVNKVHFGARVSVSLGSANTLQEYQIARVDKADIVQQNILFIPHCTNIDF